MSADFTRIISSREGLTNNSILSLSQGASGRVWLGTCEGLNVWNGTTVTPAGVAADDHLSGNLIERIHQSGDDAMWIETNYGLDLMLSGGSILPHKQFRGMYRMLSWRRDSALVLTQADSLFRYDASSDRFWPVDCPSCLSYGRLLSCTETPDGTLWLMTKDGVYRTGSAEFAPEQVRPMELTFASAEGESAFLVDSRGVLYRFDFADSSLEYCFNLGDEIRRHGKISDIVADGDDIVVAYLFDGVTRLRFCSEAAARYVPERLPLTCGVFDLMTDGWQPILWIATDGYGLHMATRDHYDIVPANFEDFILPLATPVRALLRDRTGGLWMATKGEGLVRIDDYSPKKSFGECRSVRHFFSELSDPAVFALCEHFPVTPAPSGGIWIGTEGEGLDYYSFTDGKIHHVAGPETLKYVHAIYESDPQTLWVATVGCGVFRLSVNGSSVPRITDWEKLDFGPLKNDSEFFFCLYPDSDGTVWIGNRGGGLIHYEPSTGKSRVYTLEEETSEVANDVWAICRTGKGDLYVGTGYGLLLFDPSEGKAVPTPVRGLIHEIQEDGEGCLWLSTNTGLVRYSPWDSMSARCGYAYGLSHLEFSDGASCRDSAGRLYFGGTNGFICLSETDFRRPPFTPDLSILSLLIDGEWAPYAVQNEVVIASGRRLMGAEALAIDYVDGGNYKYSFRVKGFDDKWYETDSKMLFPALPPGRYTLEARYLNQVTGYESPVLSTAIRIMAPWYATLAAKALYALLAGGVILAITLLALRRRKMRRARQIERMKARWKEETLSSKLSLLQNFASQIERPVSLQAVPCQQILDYGRSDEYIRSCAEKALNYGERVGHTIRLFRSLSESEEGMERPEVRLFSPRDVLSDLVETYQGLAHSRGVRFTAEIPHKILWATSPRIFASVADMLLTDAFFHAEGERNVLLSVSSEEDNLVMKIRMEGHWPDSRAAELLFDRTGMMEYLEKGRRDGYELQDEMRLAVCHNMVSVVDGKIGHSVDGADSVFTAVFPRMSSEEASPVEESGYRSVAPVLMEEGGPVPATPGGDSKSLFILGKDIEILQAVTGVFQSEFRIKTFSSVRQMKDALLDAHPDVIVVEMLSDSEETESAIRAVKEDKATMHIPVILISNVSRESLPVDACVTLPLDTRDLKRVVGQNIRRMETLEDYFTSAVSIYELSDGKKLHREDKEFLEKLYRVIRDNMHRPDITTGFIAAEMGTSVRSLYSRLEGLVSITPGNIIREYRLSYAAQLLAKTRLTVDEIIFRSGFSNRGTFFKNFSKRYSCTPKAWRRDHQ